MLAQPLLGGAGAEAAADTPGQRRAFGGSAMPEELRKELWSVSWYAGVGGRPVYRGLLIAFMLLMACVELGEYHLSADAFKSFLPGDSHLQRMLVTAYLALDVAVYPLMIAFNLWLSRHVGSQGSAILGCLERCSKSPQGERRLLMTARRTNRVAVSAALVLSVFIVTALVMSGTYQTYFGADSEDMDPLNKLVVRAWVTLEVVGEPFMAGQMQVVVMLFSLNVAAHDTRVRLWCRDVSAGRFGSHEEALDQYIRICDDVRELSRIWQGVVLATMTFVVLSLLSSLLAFVALDVTTTTLALDTPALLCEGVFLAALANAVAVLNEGTAMCARTVTRSNSFGSPEQRAYVALELQCVPFEFLIYGLRITRATFAKAMAALASLTLATAVAL